MPPPVRWEVPVAAAVFGACLLATLLLADAVERGAFRAEEPPPREELAIELRERALVGDIPAQTMLVRRGAGGMAVLRECLRRGESASVAACRVLTVAGAEGDALLPELRALARRGTRIERAEASCALVFRDPASAEAASILDALDREADPELRAFAVELRGFLPLATGPRSGDIVPGLR